MKLQKPQNLVLLPSLARRREKKERLDQLAKDEFQYSRPKMVASWTAGQAVAGAAGLGIAKLWDLASLPANFGPAGMLIGGLAGAVSTYAVMGSEVPFAKRLGVSLAVGAGSALAWNHFGLAGLKEGLGMAVGGMVGAYVGAKSVPAERASVLNQIAGATFGFGMGHVAGIVGATGGWLGAAGVGALSVTGAAAGDIIAKGNRRIKAREL
jgi:hypothetical protein